VGQVNFAREAIKMNAVLFLDSVDVVVEDFKKDDMFNVDQVKGTMKVHLMDSEGEFDALAEQAFG